MTVNAETRLDACPSLAAVPLRPPVRGSLMFGASLIVLGLGGFTGWAATGAGSAGESSGRCGT